METGLVGPALSRLRALFPASVSVNPYAMKRRLGACRAAVSGFVFFDCAFRGDMFEIEIVPFVFVAVWMSDFCGTGSVFGRRE